MELTLHEWEVIRDCVELERGFLKLDGAGDCAKYKTLTTIDSKLEKIIEKYETTS